MKHGLIVLKKIGCNSVRLFPTTPKELKWEGLPNEILIDQGNQSIKSIMKTYPEYYIKYKAKFYKGDNDELCGKNIPPKKKRKKKKKTSQKRIRK